MAAQAIGSVVIDIAANVARMQSDMAQVQQAVNSTMASIQQKSAIASSALKAVGGALAGAFAINAMREFAARTIESVASLKEFSEKTGASVENLSALQSVARL